MKKVLLIVIDSATGWVFEKALAAGRLPNLAQLAGAGDIRFDSVAVFPSITPAATSAIATGAYPCQHNIAGNYWYEEDDHRVVYYGSDILAILNEGIGDFFEDFLVRFNNHRLQAATLFDRIEATGLHTASLNFLIFHGPQPHTVTVPLLLRVLPGVPVTETVYGPTILSVGDLVKPRLPGWATPLKGQGGPLHKFGFDDDNTATLLLEMAKKSLPAFTLAYFPDNDLQCHLVGPEAAMPTIEKIDRCLGELIGVYGSVDRLLAEVCIVLTGDHAQCDIVDDKSAGIMLDDLLDEFAIAEAGTPMETGDDLVICPNLRAAQIYFHTPALDSIRRVVERLLSDERIDQVMWTASLLDPDEPGYRLCTQDRGDLHFWQGGDGEQTAQDVYGCHWSWTGDLRTVDATVTDGQIVFDDYPNAFERIACLLDLRSSGHLVATARPGYEFCLHKMSVHTGGGSHAALHRVDSLSPLLLAGAPADIHLPDHPRTVDLYPLCLSVLGLPAERAIGESHAS